MGLFVGVDMDSAKKLNIPRGLKVFGGGNNKIQTPGAHLPYPLQIKTRILLFGNGAKFYISEKDFKSFGRGAPKLIPNVWDTHRTWSILFVTCPTQSGSMGRCVNTIMVGTVIKLKVAEL